MFSQMLEADIDEPESALEAAPGLSAAIDFFQALNESGVRYCHWKSNIRLVEALKGETDLDLLVLEEDAERFREIVGERDIKRLLAPPAKAYPGMMRKAANCSTSTSITGLCSANNL